MTADYDVIVRGAEESDPVLGDRRVPVVALPATFSRSDVVEAIAAALTRNESLRTIETLVGELSYATGNVLNIDGGLTLRRL